MTLWTRGEYSSWAFNYKFKDGLRARECFMSVKVLWSTELQKIHVLTGGPSFPGKPRIPFFPWGPFKRKKISQSVTNSAPQSIKSNKKCLTLSPGSPTNPWGPGKPCRKDVALVFLCMHLCYPVTFVSICSYQDSRVALLSRCSDFSWLSLLATWNKVMGTDLSSSTVQNLYYTHYVSLWTLNAINSANSLWRKKGR